VHERVVGPAFVNGAAAGGIEGVGEGGDAVGADELLAPLRRDRGRAPAGAGQLACDGGGGVGVVAEVGGSQHGITAVVGAGDRPERRLERIDAVASALDLGWHLHAP
jgi:hypothetical protein